MPSRNTLKVYLPHSYYHAYNRGWNRGQIFFVQEDYEYFEKLLSRALAPKPLKDDKGRLCRNFYTRLQLNAYCLMPNHFHFLLYQSDEVVVASFIQSICTAYAIYFNKKYNRRGPLFESRFKAVRIDNDGQLQHISRYIHLNHWHYKTWPYSSYSDYTQLHIARDWVSPGPILKLFDSAEEYVSYCADYEEIQRAKEREKKLPIM